MSGRQRLKLVSQAVPERLYMYKVPYEGTRVCTAKCW